MRKVDYERFLEGSKFDAWCDRAEQARNQLLEAVAREEEPKFDNKIWKDLKDNFSISGNFGKCMYCEGIYEAGSYSDAEHFRPKGKVTEDGREIDHPGYYWLAYEWQNLLLSCRKCNSSPGKQNEFPIAGIRVKNPDADPSRWWDELKIEEPLLLQPYFDNPEQHFDADESGTLLGKTEQGQKTIDVCNLNRSTLREARVRAEVEMRAKLALILLNGSWDKLDSELFGEEDPFSTYLNCRAPQIVGELMRRLQ